jgi:3-isopropylmalate/(R)-2-methylmalate dehydratase large subunit
VARIGSDGRTLVDQIWDDHLVGQRDDGRDLLYVDRVVMDEVRAPDAIRLLEASGRPLRRPDLAFATIDHTIGTQPGRDDRLAPAIAAIAAAVRVAADRHAFRFLDIGSAEQGISHVVAPEMGLVLPGTTYVCSDSHASTVGALGALAFGCGTTDLAHVLATLGQLIWTSWQILQVDRMFVGIVLIGVLGVASTAVLQEIEHRLMPWRQR